MYMNVISIVITSCFYVIVVPILNVIPMKKAVMAETSGICVIVFHGVILIVTLFRQDQFHT
jgi:hypothetical protein